jgi:hypothetical protein
MPKNLLKMHARVIMLALLFVTLVTAETYSFGKNSGRLGRETEMPNFSVEPGVIIGLSGLNIIATSSARGHSVVLTSEGRVYSWGGNACGNLGDGTTIDRNSPILVDGLENIVAINAGPCFSAAVTSSGQLYFWGDITVFNSSTPALITFGSVSNKKIVSICNSGESVLAVTDAGELHAWGDVFGSGIGVYSEPTRFAPLKGYNITAVTGGFYHFIAKTSDGQIMSLGYNSVGQLGGHSGTSFKTPVSVVGLPSNIASIHASCEHSLALTDSGEVYTWGQGYYQPTGYVGDLFYLSFPTKIGGILIGTKIVAAVSCCDHTLMLSDQGIIYSFGFYDYGQLGNGTFSSMGDYFDQGVIPASPFLINQMMNGKTVTLLGGHDGYSIVVTALMASSTSQPATDTPTSDASSITNTPISSTEPSTNTPLSSTNAPASSTSKPIPPNGQEQSGENDSKNASGTAELTAGLIMLFTSLINLLL